MLYDFILCYISRLQVVPISHSTDRVLQRNVWLYESFTAGTTHVEIGCKMYAACVVIAIPVRDATSFPHDEINVASLFYLHASLNISLKLPPSRKRNKDCLSSNWWTSAGLVYRVLFDRKFCYCLSIPLYTRPVLASMCCRYPYLFVCLVHLSVCVSLCVRVNPELVR